MKLHWHYPPNTLTHVRGVLKSEIGETVRAIRFPKLYPCSTFYYRLKLRSLIQKPTTP